ncbi:hypothetical protein [Paenibacillus spongiae]|uniref:Class I SAM-dependent methyltransferase n=1 Tax=Paenibacillus spongiae TaxID=2909671 RepID=A0ABY5S8F1_9BACL|nr:hypothetical protein [Paenibacillus spongiae]UVI30202.1 hypothetical protein L1F29_33370 [Paenibacillus spongiae]
MNTDELAKQMASGKFKAHLQKEFSPEAIRRMGELSANELRERLNQVISVPINLSGEMSHELLEFYYTASWYNIFEDRGLPRNASVFEVGAGDIVYIPKALNAYSAGQGGKYVTANLNNELTMNFREKTQGMQVDVEIIQDDGANILNYYSEESFEVIAFHHALNDIIQTIIAGIEGIDTVNNNWWTIEPQLLQAVMSYHNSGELKDAAYEPFIHIIDTCNRLLKKGGYMIFDNCTYAGYEELGYSSDFHSAYINLAREWIKEANLGLEEVKMPSYDDKWWMVLRKV